MARARCQATTAGSADQEDARRRTDQPAPVLRCAARRLRCTVAASPRWRCRLTEDRAPGEVVLCVTASSFVRGLRRPGPDQLPGRAPGCCAPRRGRSAGSAPPPPGRPPLAAAGRRPRSHGACGAHRPWSAARRRDAPAPGRCAPPAAQHTCARCPRRHLRHPRATGAGRRRPRSPGALGDQGGDLLQVGVAGRRLSLCVAGHRAHRGRQQPPGSLAATPTRTTADVDADAHPASSRPPGQSSPVSAGAGRLAHRDRPAERVADLRTASVPPPWARSSLPPPPPPSAWRRDPHQRAGLDAAARARLRWSPRRRPGGPWPRR